MHHAALLKFQFATSCVSAMPVGRGKDNVPTWDGEPASWPEFRRAALLYLESTKWENRYLCGPRLAAELTGSAKSSIANKRPAWLSSSDGVHKLLRHLQGAVSEPVLPEVGNALRTYFRQLRRKRGETMTSFTVRHREEYEKACRALTRMVSGHAPDLGSRSSRTTSRRSSWSGIGLRRSQTPGPEQRPETGGNLDEEQARGSLDGSTTTDHLEEDPWTTWYREEERRAWAARGWVDYGDSYHEPRATNDEAEDSDYEEQLVEILPDVVKGWLLLEKAGLDSLERGIIQSEFLMPERLAPWAPLPHSNTCGKRPGGTSRGTTSRPWTCAISPLSVLQILRVPSVARRAWYSFQ